MDLQIFATFLISFVIRAFDATPASSAALGLAAFEPSFTQEPRFAGGPKTFYGMLLVVSLVMVMVLAVALTVKQACARHRWLATAMADAQAQSSFAELGDGGGGAAEVEEDRGEELAENPAALRARRMPDGGSGAGLPESGLVEAAGESSAVGGGSLAVEPELTLVEAAGAGGELHSQGAQSVEGARGAGRPATAARPEREAKPEAEPAAGGPSRRRI